MGLSDAKSVRGVKNAYILYLVFRNPDVNER